MGGGSGKKETRITSGVCCCFLFFPPTFRLPSSPVLKLFGFQMDTACRAVMDPAHSAGYPALFIDIKHKPTVFHIDCWKKIMMGLYFEITEPESNRQLDLIEVKVTKHVTLAPLVGFKILLQSLSST